MSFLQFKSVFHGGKEILKEANKEEGTSILDTLCLGNICWTSSSRDPQLKPLLPPHFQKLCLDMSDRLARKTWQKFICLRGWRTSQEKKKKKTERIKIPSKQELGCHLPVSVPSLWMSVWIPWRQRGPRLRGGFQRLFHITSCGWKNLEHWLYEPKSPVQSWAGGSIHKVPSVQAWELELRLSAHALPGIDKWAYNVGDADGLPL